MDLLTTFYQKYINLTETFLKNQIFTLKLNMHVFVFVYAHLLMNDRRRPKRTDSGTLYFNLWES